MAVMQPKHVAMYLTNNLVNTDAILYLSFRASQVYTM